MIRRAERPVPLVVIWLMALSGGAAAQGPPSAQAPPPLHVLRIAAGPAGAEADGVFTFSEERSIFSRSADREIIVLFQWEGVPGPHRMVAHWRSPDGNLTSTSAIDYTAATRRFGAYWRLPITPEMPLGTWALEVTVDGEPAGRFTFEVRDEAVAGFVKKRPLTQAELYDLLTRTFVQLERSVASGTEVHPAAGVLMGDGRVYTSMAALDGTDTLSMVLPGGARRDVGGVLAWHRRQDWAVLTGAPDVDAPLTAAPADSLRIGERCFTLQGAGAAGRVLMEGTLVGQADLPGGGRRYLASFLAGVGAPGAPLLNQFGELIGLVGGSMVAGPVRLDELIRMRAELQGEPVVAVDLIALSDGRPATPFLQLRRSGELVPPLRGRQHVISGGFARGIIRQGPGTVPADQRDSFGLGEKELVVFVSWSPQQRLRGLALLKIYDADNELVITSKPKKTDLRRGQVVLTSWAMPIPSRAGSYRADVILDEDVMWRGFVRIHP